LKQADSRRLPFDEDAFDLVYNAYMLDLIPAQDMPLTLGEFWRVLRPGGRLRGDRAHFPWRARPV
jgi:ubiquinone/menaquinone biosynthesis C-methylase UbiE